MFILKTPGHDFIMKKKIVGFKTVSELDLGYAQFQSYININFYYRHFFPQGKLRLSEILFTSLEKLTTGPRRAKKKII